MNTRTYPSLSLKKDKQKCQPVKQACSLPFKSRLRSHMDTYGWSRVSPTGNEKDCWQTIHKSGSEENNRRTAYIHIPFCGTLCTFCDFQRKPGTPAMAADYAKLVIKELDWYQDSRYVSQGGFEALYMGGGTPSLLPAEAMVELVNAARKVLGLSKSAEITIESTVHDLSEEKIHAIVQAGVTRISLGVQTFNTSMRRQLGRLSDKEAVCQIIEKARKAGIKTISADILYRLPGQEVKLFREDLDCAIELGLDGISLYPLIAMGGTPLEKGLKENKIRSLPNLRTELEQCQMARQYLIAAGYRQDTCTHYVKSGDRNLYADVRLDDGDCLPIGCSAGGYLGPLIIMNSMNKQMYQSQILINGGSGYMASLMLPSKSRLLRSVTGQLQRGFIDLQTIWQDESVSPQILEDKINDSIEMGLLEESGQRYILTDNGWNWCYNIAADFASISCSKEPAANIMMSFSQTESGRKHPASIQAGVKHKNTMYGFSMKDLSVLGVMCALVVVVQFAAAMLLHTAGIALIPGVMQFVMAFASCIILFIALRKVPRFGALSIMSAVYSMVTMLLSGSILMGLGLIIGGVLGDITARRLGGIQKKFPLIAALVIYRTSQTTFSRLYAFVTDMTQVQFIWYLVVLSVIASMAGAITGGLAGMKLSKKITSAGVMT